VPGSIREAALALGVPKYRVTVRVVLSSAREGIVTGALLAMARNRGGDRAVNHDRARQLVRLDPVGSADPGDALVIFNFATSPYANWNALAWGTALLLVLIMLA